MKEQSKLPICCKLSTWFIWRALIMSILLLAFAGYFYYDGKTGYKKKNTQYYSYMGYLQARELFKADRIKVKNGEPATSTLNAETWAQFLNNYKVKVYEEHEMRTEITDVEGCFPDNFTFPQRIPEEFAAGYDQLLKNPDTGSYEIWKNYTEKNNLEITADEHFKSKDTIESQFNWSIGSAVLGGLAFALLIRNSRRSMIVDADAYTAPGGKRITWEQITRLDRRKWAKKGLAYLHYKEGETIKQSKIDGMIYGQFDPDNPNNAEHLFQFIEKNLPPNAEIEDYESEDDEEDEEGKKTEQEASDKKKSEKNKEQVEKNKISE